MLKDNRLSIAGVKKILKSNTKKLDDGYRYSLNSFKTNKLINKGKNLIEKINKLKSYGKKNSH